MSTLTSGRPNALKRRKEPKRPEKLTVGQYLLKRLAKLGIGHLFLTPDTHLERLEELIDEHPKINLYATSSCALAAQMADGYGKAKGIACLATQEPGGEVLDALMRASYESVPLVIIFGTSQENIDTVSPQLPFDDSMSFLEKLYRQFTCAWTELSDAKIAAKKIDRVLDYCLFYKRPVCIELPQEVIDHYIPQHFYSLFDFEASDPDSLEEALLEAHTILAKAKHPLIFMGRDVVSQKLESLLLYFAERWHIPVTSSILAKNHYLESHPNYSGDLTLSLIDRADLILVFGSHLMLPDTVQILSTSVKIKNRTFPDIYLREMIGALCSLQPEKSRKLWHSRQRNHRLRDDIFLVTVDPSLLAKITHFFAGEVIATAIKTPQYSLASAIGASLALPHKYPVAIVKESELRLSLSELVSIYKTGLRMLICVEGNATWVKELLPEITILRRKMPHLPTEELVIVSLE